MKEVGSGRFGVHVTLSSMHVAVKPGYHVTKFKWWVA